MLEFGVPLVYMLYEINACFYLLYNWPNVTERMLNDWECVLTAMRLNYVGDSVRVTQATVSLLLAAWVSNTTIL
jgi:hypothetical protein